MSLAAPEETSIEAAFVCNKSESVLSVIEKCLDNGLGSCLVVGDDHRFIGRISLDDIRRALADGTAIVDPTLGWHPAGNMIAANPLRNDVDQQEILRPVVDFERPPDGCPDRSLDAAHPGRNAPHDERRLPLRARRIHLRMDLEQGPLRQQVRGRLQPLRRRPARRRRLERHRGAASGAGRSRHRARRRGDRARPHLRRDHQRGALLRRHAGDRRRRSPDLVHEPRGRQARLHGADQGDHPGPSLRPAGRDRTDHRLRPRPRHRRGRGLRRSARRALSRQGGRAVRRRLLLLVLRQQDRDHGRRRHVRHRFARARDLAARAARPRHVAGPLLLARAGGLQLSHHQPAGGDRPVADLARQRGAAAQRPHRRALSRGAEGHSRRAVPAAAARRVPPRRVDDLRAGAGGQAPAADARGP